MYLARGDLCLCFAQRNGTFGMRPLVALAMVSLVRQFSGVPEGAARSMGVIKMIEAPRTGSFCCNFWVLLMRLTNAC